MKKPAPDPQSCASCKFFQGNQDDEYGYCRRFPPVPIVVDDAPTSIQPTTIDSEYCGEYVRRTH